MAVERADAIEIHLGQLLRAQAPVGEGCGDLLQRQIEDRHMRLGAGSDTWGCECSGCACQEKFATIHCLQNQ